MSILRIINRALRTIGYKVVSNRILPPPNLEILDLYFDSLGGSSEECYFVQVGACDGLVSDQAVHHIGSSKFRSLLIEPVPDNFAKLEDLHRGNDNVKVLNVAVSHAKGRRIIYTVANQGRWKDSPVARQIASFDRGHLVRFGIEDTEIQPMEIGCVTLSEVVEQGAFPRIDLLQIDTEGFDAEVVKMALSLAVKPKAIYFEFCHIRKTIPKSEFDDVYASLRECGYRWVHDLKNSLAILE